MAEMICTVFLSDRSGSFNMCEKKNITIIKPTRFKCLQPCYWLFKTIFEHI